MYPVLYSDFRKYFSKNYGKCSNEHPRPKISYVVTWNKIQSEKNVREFIKMVKKIKIEK